MNETPDATEIFAPLWKRKWLILLVGVLVGVATYLYYDHEPKVYGAATGIYLGSGSEVQALLGNGQATATENDRSITNQVVLINSSVVGAAVQRRLLKEGNTEAASGSAAATAAQGSDFISIATTAGSGQAAADLANAYVQVYLRLREASYRKNIEIALNSTNDQLRATEETVTPTASETLQIQNLVDRVNQLRSQLSLGDAGNRQINPAVASAEPLSPKPTRNAIFGFVLGIVLAALGCLRPQSLRSPSALTGRHRGDLPSARPDHDSLDPAADRQPAWRASAGGGSARALAAAAHDSSAAQHVGPRATPGAHRAVRQR